MTTTTSSTSSWFSTTKWTKEENKRFESALALYGDQDPERWLKVAAMLPGKSVSDVMEHYKQLEHDVSDIETRSMATSLVVDNDDRDFDARRKKPSCITSRAQETREVATPSLNEDEQRQRKLTSGVNYATDSSQSNKDDDDKDEKNSVSLDKPNKVLQQQKVPELQDLLTGLSVARDGAILVFDSTGS